MKKEIHIIHEKFTNKEVVVSELNRFSSYYEVVKNPIPFSGNVPEGIYYIRYKNQNWFEYKYINHSWFMYNKPVKHVYTKTVCIGEKELAALKAAKKWLSKSHKKRLSDYIFYLFLNKLRLNSKLFRHKSKKNKN